MKGSSAYDFQVLHIFCKFECKKLKKQLKIKWDQITFRRVNRIDEIYYIYIDPKGYRGSYRGCCKYDALRNCLMEEIKNVQTIQKEK